MFSGSVEIAMDSKGRVIVPLSYRELFGEQLIACAGPEKCLYLYTQDDFKEVSEQMMAIPDSNNPKLRMAKRRFFSLTFPCDIDKQGRILVPKKLRDYANLEADVTYVGNGMRLELWDRAALEEADDPNMSMQDVYDSFEIRM